MKKLILICLICCIASTSYAYDTKKYAANGLIPHIPNTEIDKHSLNSVLQYTAILKPDPKYIPPGDYPKQYKLHQTPMYHPPLFQVWPRY